MLVSACTKRLKTWMSDLEPRRAALLAVLGTILLGMLICQYSVLPAFNQWRTAKASVEIKASQYARLAQNLAVKQSVQDRIKELPPEAYQLKSDEITLSEFLRNVEAISYLPSMTLINAKPLPVEDQGAYRIFRMKLSVAGKLEELLRFLFKLTTGKTPVGLESFRLRGVQGSELVECSLAIWMVRLTPELTSGSDARQAR